MKVDLSKPLSQTMLGKLIGITRQSVGDIEGAGTCDRTMSGAVWLQTYCAHIREQAAGRDATGELSEERARLARAQAVRVEMQNAVTQRQLLPVRVLEMALGRVCAQIAGHLEALPGRLKRRCPHWRPTDFSLLETEISKARNTAADARLSNEDIDDGFIGPSSGD